MVVPVVLLVPLVVDPEPEPEDELPDVGGGGGCVLPGPSA